MKTVHFICTGNIYRSRMAEAYFNSIVFEKYKATSSGIYAEEHDSGPVSWYSMRIIYNNWFVSGMSRDRKKTTLELLKQSDIVIFMEDMHFQHCNGVLGYVPLNYEIWNIPDLFPSGMSDKDIINTAENTFLLIKNNVNKLVKTLANTHDTK